MKLRSPLCLALLAAFAVNANASVINLQVASLGSPAKQTNAAAYKSVVDAAMANTSAYKGSKSVSVYDNLTVKNYFGSISSYAFETTINFGVTDAQAGNWNFRTGVDFGYGGAMFLDGVALSFDSSDMWWGGSYTTSHGSLQGIAALSSGNHVLKIYGLEACCDGTQQAQFKAANASAYTTFASADKLNAVPEPVSIATFGLGAGALALIRRRRKSA